MMNCTKGTIDDTNFSKPMPIIGLYIAGATLLCIVQMVRDLVSGFKSKQFWIPAERFSIDSASLTIIGVAIKLSVDLNSSMPSNIDQLAKIVTSAFICTLLINISPSLAKLRKGELLANAAAFAILLVTSIVNLCIQLNTGVIHAFKKAHIFIVAMTCFLSFIFFLGVAPSFPAIKNRQQLRFEKLHQQVLKLSFGDGNKNIKESVRMKEYLKKFSMMAQSGCPHFFSYRSEIYVGLVLYGLMPALALLFVLFATIAHGDNMVGINTCSGKSDYGWSVVVILTTQIIAVVVGLVAPLCKVSYVFGSLEEKSKKESNMGTDSSSPSTIEESVEVKKYWMQRISRTTDDPLFPFIQDWLRSPRLYRKKEGLCEFFSLIQDVGIHSLTGVLVTTRLLAKMTERTSSNTSDLQESNNLRPYFLHVEKEERRVDAMVVSSTRVTQIYLDNAKKREPKQLIHFLQHYLSNDFEGVYSFESLSGSDGPPNCWSLPLLTLTCIAVALPNIDQSCKEQLMKSVIEGLVYVKLVEDNLNAIQDLVNIRAAANLVWLGLDRGHSWMDTVLPDLAKNSTSPTEVLSSLAESAEEKHSKIVNDQKNDHSKAPPMSERRSIWEALAAHSMRVICRTLLQDCQSEGGNLNTPSHEIFKKLRQTIADILGACFTNLGLCILQECKRSTIEKRRETAFRMLGVFGEIERIMEILEEEGRRIPNLPDDKRGFIDEWRSYPSCHQTQ